MKLEHLRRIIKEEVSKAIIERRIVRTEVRKAIAEALPKLGSGQRFKSLVKKIKAKSESTEPKVNEYHARNPAAIAAAIGRKKYGKAKFQKMAAAGRRRHSK